MKRTFGYSFVIVILLMTSSFAQAQMDSQRYPLKPGIKYITDSVNCHSTSLNVLGLLSYPSYVNEEEMAFVLEQNCSRTALPKRGVLAISGLGTGYSHSYVHVSEAKVFEKRSVSKRDGYTIAARGTVDGMSYYRCERKTSPCEDAALQKLAARLTFAGRYYADLAKGLSDFREREKYQAFNKRILGNLENHRAASGSCANLKQSLILRSKSLSESASHLSGLGLFIPAHRENPI
ncbi:MAG: hypothetical protein EOP05_08630 [Proteobacteria bacterium]|nr:MAG: hypothetical protein EOP05_08630 [Pseudomonadota bacterium]